MTAFIPFEEAPAGSAEGRRQIKCAIGQDSHAFGGYRPLKLGGVLIEGSPGLSANSDGDVVLHALTNAISGITGRNILGEPADQLCRQGVIDSAAYLRLALKDFAQIRGKLVHISFSIECKTPKLAPYIEQMKASVAALCGIAPSCVGITATTGEGLTAFGQGRGIAVMCILTAAVTEQAE